MSTHHLQMKVSTVLEMLGSKRETKRLVKMFNMSESRIRADCDELLEAGRLYIPTQGCDTDDPTGKCNGHD